MSCGVVRCEGPYRGCLGPVKVVQFVSIESDTRVDLHVRIGCSLLFPATVVQADFTHATEPWRV